MIFQEWSMRIFRTPVLVKLLPLELKRTFPIFSVEDDQLCASFIGFYVKPYETGVMISNPKCYLKITYPQGTLQAYNRLPVSDLANHVSKPCNPKDIKRLTELCDKVILAYDEKSDDFTRILTEHNSFLNTLLEPGQLKVLNRYACNSVSEE